MKKKKNSLMGDKEITRDRESTLVGTPKGTSHQ